MAKNQKPDTQREGSWAEQEARKPKVHDGKLPEWWGKPSILIPGFQNAVSLGPIDPKWARTFNG